MDIAILLFLQAFRQSINDALTPFMEGLSLLSITFLIMVPVFYYWVINKRQGLYTLVSYYVCLGLNVVIKLTACVLRPWIRDPRIVPAGDAIHTATGYSFPSGHTASAGPLYGGIAVTSRKTKRWLSVVCIILILLTGFSRVYLGVHTPQDVLVALLLSVFSLWAVNKVFVYLEGHPEKENMFLAGLFVFGVLCLVYITFKPYPYVYKDGVLLVDPQVMMIDGYGDIALMIAFSVGRFLEQKFIRFESPGLNKKGIVTGILGLIPLGLMIVYLGKPLEQLLGSHWGRFLKSSMIVLYCIAVYPAVIKVLCGNRERKE